ncbi:MAG: phage antirepressor [Tetragenococcus halophilus]|nr:phage antirepressor [Tetragenococcus halophilus]
MEVQTFNFETQEVRTIIKNNGPWFVAKDITDILGYSNSRDAVKRHVDEEDKGVAKHDTPGGLQQLTSVNESGMYALIFGSKLPKAKEFKRWVTSEVLPSIRKHGTYMTAETIEKALTDPDTIIQLATTLKEEREQRLIAEQRVNELQPKASYYDLILQNKSLLSVTQIAKDYGKSAHWLNEKLHELGIQYKQGGTWLLYQNHAENGYTQSTTHVISDSKNKLFTKWTQKGRLFIYELLKEEGILPMIEREEME